MRVTLLLLAFVSALPGYAQVVAVTDESFIRAALMVASFDHFEAGCRRAGGFSDEQAGKVAAWRDKNGVDGIRSRLDELDAHPAYHDQIQKGVAELDRMMAGQNVGACLAAVTLVGLPDAQFAVVSPNVLAPPAPPAPPAPSAPSVRAPAAPPAPATAELLGQIDSFGFDTRPKMGVGGFIALDIYPIVLLRSGEALTDVEGLTFPGGLAAHKRAHAEDWTSWRKTGGEIQIKKEDGWTNLPFQTTYASLPAGLRLDGLFRYLGGAGNVAVGGTQSVVAYTEYHFSPDGRVQRGGGAGASAEAGDASVVTRSVSPDRRGRYEIDGLILRITYDDGSGEQRILITDPTDPKGAIWLDGVGYVQRR